MVPRSVRVMARHTTFRFCLDPTVEQTLALARHAGAARFAYNQCLRLHLNARERHRARDGARDGHDNGIGEADQARDGVPWSRFSLINAFNRWKVSEDAGRRFLVTGEGVAKAEVTGLPWRGEVLAQVLEGGAVDVARGLAAWIDSRSGKRKGRGILRKDLTLKERTFECYSCGHVMDRDLNAAANLAAWAEDHTRTVDNGAASGDVRVGDRQAAGPVINACRRDGTGPHTRVGGTSPDDAGTLVQAAPAA